MNRIKILAIVLVLVVSTMACRLSGRTPVDTETPPVVEESVPTNTVSAPATEENLPTGAISYGSESRQWLLIYKASSPEPTPVYIWAHANGSSADKIPTTIINEMNAIDVSVISWESIPMLKTMPDVQTGWADAELMLAWVQANADTYNIDANSIILGGASRGTGLSWKIAHNSDPAIKGIYMYNALPDGFWANPEVWSPATDVTKTSPSVFFAYGPAPGDDDIHDPENGMLIGDQYEAFGIEDQFTLVHSLGGSAANRNSWQFLQEFVLSVVE